MGKFICSTEIQIKSQKNYTDYNRSGKKIKFLMKNMFTGCGIYTLFS